MATLNLGTITVPDNKATEILNLITDYKGYSGFDPQDNAETRANFLKRIMKEELRALYIRAKVRDASNLSTEDAKAAAEGVSFD